MWEGVEGLNVRRKWRSKVAPGHQRLKIQSWILHRIIKSAVYYQIVLASSIPNNERMRKYGVL